MPASNTSILIIDEKLGNYSSFRQQYQSSYAFEVASSMERALPMISGFKPDLVVLGIHKDGAISVQQVFNVFLPRIKKLLKGKCPVVVLSTRSMDAWKKKIQDQEIIVHEHDFQHPEILHGILQQALIHFVPPQHLPKAQKLKTAPEQENTFLVYSPQMIEIRRVLQKLAGYPDVPVLILGETGVGKEVACRYLHQAKQIAQRLPFEAVNLSIYSDELLFSEIFGHKKGSFTGADQDKEGAFEKARNGTLFLDEVGDISTKAQVALLRVIQERTFRKVGDLNDKALEAQLIFATNKNLEEEIANKNFREDLYHRIKGYTVYIPPLRERIEEIPAFIDRFWADLCVDQSHPMYGQRGRDVFTPAALEILYQYSWTGNVRELRGVIQQIVIDTDGRSKKVVDPAILPMRFFHTKSVLIPKSEPAVITPIPEKTENIRDQEITDPSTMEWPLSKRTAFNELKEFEKTLIKWGGRRNDAAKELGLSNDQNLRYNILKYHKKYPDIFSNFPIVCLLYKLDKEV